MNDTGSNKLTTILLGFLLVGLIALTGLAAGAAYFLADNDTNLQATSAPVIEVSQEPTAITEIQLAEPVELETGGVTIDEAAVVEPAVEPAVEVAQEVPAAAGLENQLISLYEKVNPSVVHIFVYVQDIPQGTGSGFIYDDDGHILTNNHVVEGADRYEVVFPTGERVAASLVGTDIDSDLGVIKVDELPETARALPLANSREIQVGQFVIAIGNPFGQESSMSFGIISGLGRSLPSQRVADGGGRYSLPQVIQTDAPINPGNSGGPLLNLNGEVVGINAAIRSDTGANTGVGFSIPINIAKRVVPAIIADGSYVYPFLGVSIAPEIDLNSQQLLGLSQAAGAYVTTVTPGGPADEAGIVPASGTTLTGGDLIVAIDGETVNSFSDLITYLVFETEVGQTVTMTVLRGNESVDLQVVLGARP